VTTPKINLRRDPAAAAKPFRGEPIKVTPEREPPPGPKRRSANPTREAIPLSEVPPKRAAIPKYVALPESDDPLHRREALAQVLLDASTQRTFPLDVHQFFRLGDEWFDAGLKRMLGIRATKLHKEQLGRAPVKWRAKTGHRNENAVYPRGILEQAWAQLKEELGPELDKYRTTPYRKEPPSPEFVKWRMQQPETSGPREAERWVKTPIEPSGVEPTASAAPEMPFDAPNPYGIKLPKRLPKHLEKLADKLGREIEERQSKPREPMSREDFDRFIDEHMARNPKHSRAKVEDYFGHLLTGQTAMERMLVKQRACEYDENGHPLNEAARQEWDEWAEADEQSRHDWLDSHYRCTRLPWRSQWPHCPPYASRECARGQK
jgi:hypothetical protein